MGTRSHSSCSDYTKSEHCSAPSSQVSGLLLENTVIAKLANASSPSQSRKKYRELSQN